MQKRFFPSAQNLLSLAAALSLTLSGSATLSQQAQDAGYPSRTSEAGQIITKARNLQLGNHGDEALNAYREAVRLDPNGNSAMLHNNIATILEVRDDLPNAMEEYKKALSFDPNLQIARDNYVGCQINVLADQASSLMKQLRYDDAIRVYQEAVGLDPKRAMGHNNLGTALQAKGDLDGAINQYNLALSIEPKMELATINAARCYLNEGRYSEAKGAFLSYLQNYPNGSAVTEAQQGLRTIKQNTHDNVGDVNTPDYFASATQHEFLRWPQGQPIRVFIANGNGVTGFRPAFGQGIIDSLNQWMAALQNKLSWVMVPSPSQANIICTWASSNKGFETQNRAPAVQGEVASYDTFNINGATLIKGCSMFVCTLNTRSGLPLTDAEIHDVCLHECGHALGIVGHSPNFHDIMFFVTNPGGGAVVRNITQRDANTINRIYAGYPSGR